MCRICEAAASSNGYLSMLGKSLSEDSARIESSKKFLDKFPSISKSMYTSLKWPAQLSKPLFEARAAFAIPTNYFQQILLDGEKMGNHFSHGSTRSIYFSGEKLILLSKSVSQEAGVPFMGSFLFLHFDKNEYSFAYDGQDLRISADVEKPLKNVITGKVEKKRIRFDFFHQNLEGRIISKEQAMQSSYVQKAYGTRGDVRSLFASADLEGYVVSVNHLSPHPFMLQNAKDFGFETYRQFQEHVLDYFSEHLGFTKGEKYNI